ncbi:hypothetical protein VXS03_17950 [Photobacterium sp. S4TG1]|uniref:hypothetical protein n=1 Tax=Photobacterium sp. S4TG1 TaxID=3114587 RepID=UPI002E198B54|nr:hypothetical protein [Photobacterium sp. S4TG1]
MAFSFGNHSLTQLDERGVITKGADNNIRIAIASTDDNKGNFVPSGTWATSASGAPLGFITNNKVLFINAIEKPNSLILGGCKINGSEIKDTHELQEVTCEN